MLVHAVCNETGANLFNLSPENLQGKYTGKGGNQRLIHIVTKVARLLQPSVLWVGDSEKVFYKKVPKEEKELDPRRLRKELPRALKSLRGGQGVLLIGTSDRPFLADPKTLCKTYERIMLIPRPDYASRYVLWRSLVRRFGGTPSDGLHFGALARISDGYSQGHMVQVVQSVLTHRRRLQQKQRALTDTEFVAPLSRLRPVCREEDEAFRDWYCKTSLGKRRIKAAQLQADDVERAKEKEKRERSDRKK
ncbi:IQ and AAA domain-containing protein 1-like [Ascaphus truei]|uniref:IQ and AAA domain-containing protein 1-like n=1 Tax=Ascaphus truei TaxID=8439 RepID=UPI003F5A1EE8